MTNISAPVQVTTNPVFLALLYSLNTMSNSIQYYAYFQNVSGLIEKYFEDCPLEDVNIDSLKKDLSLFQKHKYEVTQKLWKLEKLLVLTEQQLDKAVDPNNNALLATNRDRIASLVREIQQILPEGNTDLSDQELIEDCELTAIKMVNEFNQKYKLSIEALKHLYSIEFIRYIEQNQARITQNEWKGLLFISHEIIISLSRYFSFSPMNPLLMLGSSAKDFRSYKNSIADLSSFQMKEVTLMYKKEWTGDDFVSFLQLLKKTQSVLSSLSYEEKRTIKNNREKNTKLELSEVLA